MCRNQTVLGLFLVIALVTVSRVVACEIRQSGFEHFITRAGDRLMDGDREFRFLGVNMPGLNLPYDYFYGIPQRLQVFRSGLKSKHVPSFQTDAQSLRMTDGFARHDVSRSARIAKLLDLPTRIGSRWRRLDETPVRT